ncbi:MAG: peptidoglycan editing factor PgeF [Acidimicrobiales bacterium]
MPVEITLQPEVRGPLSVYGVEHMRHFGIDAFVTDRFGGVSLAPFDTLNLGEHVGDRPEHVEENRRRVTAAIGVEYDDLVTARQVHGHDVVDVDATTRAIEGDALVTSQSGVALAILVADCVPILMVDESTSRFALVHAGWRGLVTGVLEHTLAHFEDPSAVHVFLGPCISSEAYQVGPEVAAHFSGITNALYADQGDRSRLDLRRVVHAQLDELGVLDDRVSQARQSTDGGELFYSDRAQRPCGRFGLVAMRSSYHGGHTNADPA